MVLLQRNSHSASAIEDREESCNPHWRAVESDAGRSTEGLAHHARKQQRQAVDIGRISCVVAQSMCKCRHTRCYVPRSKRHSGYAPCARRRHRTRDRNGHWSLVEKCARNPRRPLSRPRSSAGRKRHYQARKGNKNAQLTSQLVQHVLMQTRKKLAGSMVGAQGLEPWTR
jgi:hypothetical protein